MIEHGAQVGMGWTFKIYFTHFLSLTDYESNVFWQGYDEKRRRMRSTGKAPSTPHLT
jgi:hypothetical protein